MNICNFSYMFKANNVRNTLLDESIASMDAKNITNDRHHYNRINPPVFRLSSSKFDTIPLDAPQIIQARAPSVFRVFVIRCSVSDAESNAPRRHTSFCHGR